MFIESQQPPPSSAPRPGVSPCIQPYYTENYLQLVATNTCEVAVNSELICPLPSRSVAEKVERSPPMKTDLKRAGGAKPLRRTAARSFSLATKQQRFQEVAGRCEACGELIGVKQELERRWRRTASRQNNRPCERHGDNMSGTAQREMPQVAIFWLVQATDSEAKLLAAGCPLDQAEPYGNCLTYGPGHYETWAHWRRDRTVEPALRALVRSYEYEDRLRGRIAFDRSRALFILYADRKLMAPSAAPMPCVVITAPWARLKCPFGASDPRQRPETARHRALSQPHRGIGPQTANNDRPIEARERRAKTAWRIQREIRTCAPKCQLSADQHGHRHHDGLSCDYRPT
jgi:hypothetical protein